MGFLAQSFSRGLRLFSQIENLVLLATFASTLSLAILQIVLRNFFDIGLIWLESFLKMQVLWLAMLGAMVATREQQHIRIDLLTRFVEGLWSRWLAFIVASFAALVSTLATYACWTLVQFEYEDQMIAFGIVPVWVCQLILPIGFGVMTLRFAGAASRALLGRSS
ncbi:MAG: TRAP transporter small permease [Pseudomonadales bacterium]